MRFYLLSILLFFCSINAFAQRNAAMDSLALRLEHVKDVKEKVTILTTLSEYNTNVNPTEGIKLGQKGLALLKNDATNPDKTKLLRYIGMSLKNQGNFTEALNYLYQSLELAQKLALPDQIAFTKRQIATIYKQQRNKAQAVKIFQEVLEYYEKSGKDANVSIILIDMGGLYADHGDVEEAQKCYERALAIVRRMNNPKRLSVVISNLGNLYGAQGNYKKAVQNYEDALELAKSQKDEREQMLCYGKIGFEYLNYLGETKPVQEEYKLDGSRESQISKAIEYIEKATDYFKKTDQVNEYQTFMRALPEAYFLGKQYEKGTEASKAYYESKENTMQKQNERDLARSELNYEFVRKKDSTQRIQEKKELLLQNEMKLKDINFAFDKKQQANKAENERRELQFKEALKRKGLQTTFAENEARLKIENEKRIQLLRLIAGVIVVLLVVLYFVRQVQFARRKVKMEKFFSQSLVETIEQERKRIAEELHDSVGQGLLVLKNKMHQDKDDTKFVDDIIGEVRGLSQNMHPYQFERLGLIASLRNTIETLQKNSEIFFSFDCQDENLENAIEKDKQIHIYRMVQETLNNVIKHSQAKACRISVYENNGKICFEIKDNGVGFNWSSGKNKMESLGLKTLESRAKLTGSTLDIKSNAGKGTKVSIEILKSN